MRILIASFAMLMALSGMGYAQSYSDPQALLESAYHAYVTEAFPDDPQAFYSANLKALFDADAERAGGEMGALSFDPFINAQDWDALTYKIGPVEPTDTGASVSVEFSNFGVSQTNVFSLVREGEGWKIDDIEHLPDAAGEGGWLLSGILAEDPLLN